MSRPLESLYQLLLRVLTCILLTLGFGLPLLEGAACRHFTLQYVLLCSGTAAAAALAQALLNRLCRGLFPLLLLLITAVEGALFFAGRGFFVQTRTVVEALMITLRSDAPALSLYGDLFCRQLAVLITLLCFALSAPDIGVTLPVMVTAAFLTALWILGLQAYSLQLLFVLPALMLIYAASHSFELTEHAHLSPALPVIAAFLLLLALLLLPPEGTTYAPLARFAEKLRQEFRDRFLFQEERARYTLASDGWMPQGEMRLGGKPEPHRTPLMAVTLSETAYLRGAILDAYTGSAWYDSVSTNRYSWQSSRTRSLRDALLQTGYPLTGDTETHELQVELLAPGASTLFTPQRLRHITLQEDMTLYFNTGSELFITRNLRPGDRYSVTYLPMKATDEGIAALAQANASVHDPAVQEITERYLSLPSHLQKEVYEIAARATAQCQTPWQKAVALRDYLSENYRYTLEVHTPPQNIDFVAWFLLGEKEGYCTYFASAMTVLCRAIGLPARYVEGYLAQPVNGSALLTGENAHAWTEVYIGGLGWVTFDATPGRGDRDQSGTQPPSAPPPPAPSSAPTEAPSEPPPTDEPPPTPPSDPPVGSEAPKDPPARLPWLWLLLLLALLLLLSWRIRVTDPLYRAARAGNASEVLLLLWPALLSCAKALHFPCRKSETPLHFAAHAARDNGVDLTAVAAAYSALLYGQHDAPPSAAHAALAAYRSLLERLHPGQKLCLVCKRAIRLPSYACQRTKKV